MLGREGWGEEKGGESDGGRDGGGEFSSAYGLTVDVEELLCALLCYSILCYVMLYVVQ